VCARAIDVVQDEERILKSEALLGFNSDIDTREIAEQFAGFGRSTYTVNPSQGGNENFAFGKYVAVCPDTMTTVVYRWPRVCAYLVATSRIVGE
jgi:hypothetical protein